MFIKLPTTRKDYVINLSKILFFYALKERVTRIEIEDGTLLDVTLSLDEVEAMIKRRGFLVSHSREE
ncbi:MAG: hypothetical protein E7677_03280 [Ruminococcaceae bacterium]|nr:hypothetical protein [Oscillospiraceae bacterium]